MTTCRSVVEGDATVGKRLVRNLVGEFMSCLSSVAYLMWLVEHKGNL